jgi:predicted MFS family arabinose efflux permease
MKNSDNPQALRAALAALAALALAMGIGRFAFTPVFPLMQDAAGLSLAEGGWLASANYLGYLAGGISAMALRMRPAAAVRAGLASIGVSTLAMGFVQHLLPWAVLRLAAGIASAWVFVYVSTWALERLAALGRPRLGGVVYAGVGTGIVLAGVTCLAVTALHGGAEAAWVALGAVVFAGSAFLWNSFRSAATRASSREAPYRWRTELAVPIVCYGLFGFGYIIPATFVPAMAKRAISDPGLFGWAWPLFGLAAVFSTLAASRLARVMSHRAIWIGGSLLMALGVAMPLMLRGLGGILLAALLVGGTFMVVTMAGLQEARRLAGAQARVQLAAMTSAFALGQIVGPLTVGPVAGMDGDFARPLLVAAGALVLSAIALGVPGLSKSDPPGSS